MREVEKVFDALDVQIRTFQNESKLSCLSSCGKCCSKSDIEATVLEFLPLAYHLYKDGKAIEVLEEIGSSESSYCYVLQPFIGQEEKGFCGNYKYRGMICRLFGFSARKDKYGNKNLVTCKSIKENQPEEYATVVSKLSTDSVSVPMMGNYSMMLHAIDFELGSKYYPINTAIKLAIEKVLSYYSYRSRSIG